MFTNLAISSLLFAPAQAPVATDSPLPLFVELKPDADGKVRIAVKRPGKVPAHQAHARILVIKRRSDPLPINGGAASAASADDYVATQAAVLASHMILGASVKDLRILRADGMEVQKNEVLQLMAEGGLVVVSTDGKRVSERFLKAFRDEMLVLVSPEFIGVNGKKGKE